VATWIQVTPEGVEHPDGPSLWDGQPQWAADPGYEWTFYGSQPTTAPNEPAERVNERTLRERAVLALQVNADYLALASPTAAQRNTQVDRLTRECSALIRITLGLLDSTDDS
jgi:hypothetical protein